MRVDNNVVRICTSVNVALFTMIFLYGCAGYRVIESTYRIDTNALHEVESVVDQVFKELGFTNGLLKGNEMKHWYWLWGENNELGRPVRYEFDVIYKVEAKQIVVHIESSYLSEGKAKVGIAKEYLSSITKNIARKLKERNLNAIAEIGSHWIPDLGI